MNLSEVLFFFIYRFFFMPLALCFVFLFLWPFNKKIKKGIALRKSEGLRETFRQNPIWIHASSGEFEYAKPVISAIKKWQPRIPIVVTYFSPSYAEHIKKHSGVDKCLPLPLDLPGPTNEFIEKLNPQMLLVARTDLWPEILLAAKKNKIPSLLFSSTFRPLSGLRYFFFFYYKLIFNKFSDVFCVSESDSASIKKTNTHTPVSVFGDTRFDQVVSRLQNSKPINENIFKNINCPIFIAGSTWPEDENIILPGLKLFLKNKRFVLVIAPHEPTLVRLQKLEKRLTQLKLSFECYSKSMQFQSEVLIIDQVGILAELYTKANLAFVGGSFKSKVHSVMEPLAAGLVTLVGPMHKNNREAIEFQNIEVAPRCSAVVCVRNPDDLQNRIQEILNHVEFSKTRLVIQGKIRKYTGGTSHVLAWVKNHYNIKILEEKTNDSIHSPS